MRAVLVLMALTVLLSGSAAMAISIPSDGSDGAFNPTANIQVNLGQAVTGTWNQAGNGNGVYDSQKWAVVFKYTSVNIPAGVTVTFKNHSSRAPVVWLVQGDVTINGTVDLSGQGQLGVGLNTEPGPGGFRGGAGQVSSASPFMLGLGPGGGTAENSGSSYATIGSNTPGPTYGNIMLLPLIGGSGGSGHSQSGDGGAGGGAILIAAANSVVLGGSIWANGGQGLGYYNGGAGSGGGIRLVCESFSGNASSNAGIRAAGGASYGAGGNGRIRVEANTNSFTGPIFPEPSVTTPGSPVLIWPPDSVPSVKIVSVGGITVPDDPRAKLTAPGEDVSLTAGSPTPFTVRLEAKNVPTDWKVQVRLVPRYGSAKVVAEASLVSGDSAASVWQATVTVPTGFSAMQARAFKP